MHDLSITNCVVGFLCIAALPACSLLIATHERQCKSDTDCTTSGLGTLCVDRVCVDGPSSSGCQGDTCNLESAAISAGSCADDSQCAGSGTPRCLKGHCVSKELAERWICPADEQVVRSGIIHYSVQVVDFLTREAPANVVAKACRNNDVACAEPVDVFTDKQGSGQVQFNLPAGFLGYFDVKSDSVTSLLYITRPITKNTLDRDLPVLTQEALEGTVGAAGFTFDPSTGLALLEALDCSGTPSGGVQFKANSGIGDHFYLIDQVPSREASVTKYDTLTNTADGCFLNLAPGFVTFTAHWGVDGPELRSFNAQIRANTITFVDMDL
jgi:hypothetical protein